MIVGKPKHGLSLLITMHGSVLPRILPRIGAVMALAAAITWIDTYLMPLQHANAAAFTGFGIALSLFLGFRNNAAYERWWEARKLWGQLIADARALAREALVFFPDAQRMDLIREMLAFVHLHRIALRQVSPDAELRRWSTLTDDSAVHALNRMAGLVQQGYRSGSVDGFGVRSLMERLASIGLAQAGCERIASTPLPFVYSLLVYRTSVLYCLLLPLGLVESAGWLTPIFTGVVAYMFFGLAAVTEELENPFGTSLNGLSLDAMCRVIEIDLMPQIGCDAPDPAQPVGGYLS